MPIELPVVQSPTDVRLRVLQLADGDPAFADALRTMMWDAYVQAGQPLGPDEEAMWMWWSHDQQTTVQ